LAKSGIAFRLYSPGEA